MENLFDAYELYLENLRNFGPSCLIKKIRTTLIRYTLPGYGLELGGTPKEETQRAIEFMKTIPLHEFKNSLNVLQNVLDSQKYAISFNVGQSCRWVLKRMLQWCSSQSWWETAARANPHEYSPLLRVRQSNASAVRVTNRRKMSNYFLRPEEMTIELQAEVKKFQTFLTSATYYKRQDPPMRESSAEAHTIHLLQILGWLHRYKEIPLESLQLSSLDDAELVYEFNQWHREERKVRPKTELMPLFAWLNIAKFLHHRNSKANKYRDISLVEELRKLLNETNDRAKLAPKAADISKKWLEWDQFLAVVKQLKRECAPRDSSGKSRSNAGIAGSYQRYLIAAFLAYMPPDRQRTLRELEVGRTLFRRGEQWFIEHQAEDYKTGGDYGKRAALLVPEIIYPELEAWLNKWRAVFEPQHNFVFTCEDGKSPTAAAIRERLKHAVYRISGQVLTPHLTRDMCVTHYARAGATEVEMEALAQAMGHSRRMQQKIYDARTKEEKIAPAMEMMLRQEAGRIPTRPLLKRVNFAAEPPQTSEQSTQPENKSSSADKAAKPLKLQRFLTANQAWELARSRGFDKNINSFNAWSRRYTDECNRLYGIRWLPGSSPSFENTRGQ